MVGRESGRQLYDGLLLQEEVVTGVDCDALVVGGPVSMCLDGVDGCVDFSGDVAVGAASPAVLAGGVTVGVISPAVAGVASPADAGVASLADLAGGGGGGVTHGLCSNG